MIVANLSFEGADKVLEAVQGVLKGIEKGTLQAVFLEWVDQLRNCITANGESTD
jgi:hypothetical protein